MQKRDIRLGKDGTLRFASANQQEDACERRQTQLDGCKELEEQKRKVGGFSSEQNLLNPAQ
jgi:hypothetical protein